MKTLFFILAGVCLAAMAIAMDVSLDLPMWRYVAGGFLVMGCFVFIDMGVRW